MTTFQPGDRVRTTRDTKNEYGSTLPVGTIGTVDYTYDRTTVMVQADNSVGRLLIAADALALEVNGL